MLDGRDTGVDRVDTARNGRLAVVGEFGKGHR